MFNIHTRIKFIVLIILSTVSSFAQNNVSITYTNHEDAQRTRYLLVKTLLSSFDTICRSKYHSIDDQQFTLKLVQPTMVYFGDTNSTEIMGPFWISPGQIHIETFRGVNNDIRYNNFQNTRLFHFFKGTEAEENRVLSKVFDIMLWTYPFTEKSKVDYDKDSITIDQASYFAKVDSVVLSAKRHFATLDKLKNKKMIDVCSISLSNFESACKLQYLSFLKYYDRTFSWKQKASKELAFFYALKPDNIDENYFYAIENIIFLSDTSKYYTPQVMVEESQFGEYVIDSVAFVDLPAVVVDTSAYIPSLDGRSTLEKSRFIMSFEENMENLYLVDNYKHIQEIAMAQWLKTLVMSFSSEVLNFTSNKEVYYSKLQEFKNEFPDSKYYEYLKRVLDSEIIKVEKEREYGDYRNEHFDYVVVDTTREYDIPDKLPIWANNLLNNKEGKSVNLLTRAQGNNLVVIAVRNYPNEKDLVYYKYLIKKYKRLKFVFILADMEFGKAFIDMKFKNELLAYRDKNEMVNLFEQNNESYFFIKSNGEFRKGYNMNDYEK